MITQPHLYAAWLVQEKLKEGIAINALTGDINEVNGAARTGCRVNRKLIQKLGKDSLKVGLTLQTFIALDTYFRQFGKSLLQAPTLVCPGVIDALVQKPRVFFLYGAKPRPKERRVDVSCWDLDAGAAVQTSVSRANAKGELVIEHVLWLSPAKLETVRAERWFRILEDDEASVVSIGSPLASLSSEVMLAEMFGAKTAFQAPTIREAQDLPFCFCWAPKVAGTFRSAFAITPDELQEMDRALAARVRANRSHAILLRGKAHEVPRTGGSWVMHGIIAAQRRAAGNVWVAICGLAGPATCAAAKMITQVETVLPWSQNKPSKILWVPVRATIREGEANPKRGDIRELVKIEFADQPQLWP